MSGLPDERDSDEKGSGLFSVLGVRYLDALPPLVQGWAQPLPSSQCGCAGSLAELSVWGVRGHNPAFSSTGACIVPGAELGKGQLPEPQGHWATGKCQWRNSGRHNANFYF